MTSLESTYGDARDFSVRSDVTFLNNGAFGATPRAVQELHFEWQRELERQPIDFLARRAEGLVLQSKEALAEALGCGADHLAFVSNVTFGTNQVVQCLDLGPGDEVVYNQHEYGAVIRMLEVLSQRRGFSLRVAQLPLGPLSSQAVVTAYTSQSGPATKLWVVSHVTSASALWLPVEELLQAARQYSHLRVLVDGAHAPGQIPLHLGQLRPDFYVGTLHKWFFCPKGTSFLYVDPKHWEQIQPMIIGWNHRPVVAPKELAWIYNVQMLGTRDITNYLVVPAGLEYAKRHPRQDCQQALQELIEAAAPDFGAPYAGQPNRLQMVCLALPPDWDEAHLHQWLWSEHKIDAPCHRVGQQAFVRPSFQLYNDRAQLHELLTRLREYPGPRP